MSSSKQRLASSTATRLSAITDMAANLETQLSELNRLRDQLRKAQLSVRRSRRIDHSKGRCRWSKAASIGGPPPLIRLLDFWQMERELHRLFDW